MKTMALISLSLFMLASCTNESKIPQLGKSSVDKVTAAMSLEEKASLLVGQGMAGFSMGPGGAGVGETQEIVAGAAGTTFALPRLGITSIVVGDGPAGLRISSYCTAFPVGTLLASTWNTELVENVGKAMGNEVLEYGVDVLLGPALNIHRNPLCGRNFEYYSEDPLVAGKIGAAMVRGIQSNGVGTSIKHFAVNSQETNRTGNDARVSTRALREIYLRNFEIIVKEAQPWTVMSSYNYINGVYASESRELLTTILRDEWGFDGLVMTDWFGGKDPVAQIYAGNDLLMPGRPDQKNAIIEGVNSGKLDIADVDTDVKRMLELVLRSPRFKGYEYSNAPDLTAHAAVTRNSASEGMVLLKNDANTLPFDNEIHTVAAFGITSYDFISGGTGSGDVNEAYVISLEDGLKNAGYALDEDVTSKYKSYMEAEKAKISQDDNNPMARFMNQPRLGEFIPETAWLDAKARTADAAIITLGRNSGEFSDRTIDGDFNLTVEEKAMIERVTTAFRKAGKKTVVIINSGGVIETASWKDKPDAILLAWQGGQEGGNSVADILKGSVNPSGKLPMTFPVNYMDHASSANFPYDYKFNPDDMRRSFASQVQGGAAEEKTPVKNVDYTVYEEDIYVGYRYFDTYGKAVSYPFGYGLSYTTFEYKAAQDANDALTVNVIVKNTGTTAGKEVVQLYIAAPKTALSKPSKELKAFAKTKLLAPGESQTLTFRLTDADLASFDPDQSAWITDAGDYKLLIAASSADIRNELTVKDVKQQVVEKVNDVLRPRQ